MAPTSTHLVACLASATSLSFTAANSIPIRERALLDIARALPNAVSGGYAPAIVDCPSSRPTIRSAATLSQDETDWLTKRRAATVQPMADFIGRVGIRGFDGSEYINNLRDNVSALPNIGIAMSGGGYRALMNGAGFIAAADDRTPGSTDAGGIGGLLQATTYVAGLSGAGWLIGSLYSNNFSTVVDLREGSSGSAVWDFENSIFEGPKEGIAVISTVSYWNDVRDAVTSKADAGFQTSVTDYWGRALSYQLINDTDGGAAYTWSSFAQDEQLTSGSIPMPMIVADGRDPGVAIVSLNATNYEINPWEMGSFDPTVYGFAPTQYLASNFSAGQIPSGGSCVQGFDNAGYMMGTSSSLFNTFLTTNISEYAGVPQFVADAFTSLLAPVGDDNNDIAQWQPNPFLGWNNATNPNADQTELGLVDGGEDLQNIPISPLLQPIRAVDVIFAIDSSADTPFNWPNATALRATYERSLSPIANGTLFPPVPDANTFINLGLNNRPTFFGCDASNFTLSEGQSVPPLIVYVPNAPYTANSNVSTFDPSYTRQEKFDIITNGLNAASQSNSTIDGEWSACVACAVLKRSLDRTGTAIPSTCDNCFGRYCWNGTLATGEPASYEPGFASGNATASSENAGPRAGPATSWVLAAGVVAGALLLV